MRSTLHTPVDLGLTIVIACGQDVYIKACPDQISLWRGYIEIMYDLLNFDVYTGIFLTKMHAIRAGAEPDINSGVGCNFGQNLIQYTNLVKI